MASRRPGTADGSRGNRLCVPPAPRDAPLSTAEAHWAAWRAAASRAHGVPRADVCAPREETSSSKRLGQRPRPGRGCAYHGFDCLCFRGFGFWPTPDPRQWAEGVSCTQRRPPRTRTLAPAPARRPRSRTLAPCTCPARPGRPPDEQPEPRPGAQTPRVCVVYARSVYTAGAVFPRGCSARTARRLAPRSFPHGDTTAAASQHDVADRCGGGTQPAGAAGAEASHSFTHASVHSFACSAPHWAQLPGVQELVAVWGTQP